MMKNRSKALLVSTIWATVYAVLAIFLFAYALPNYLSSDEDFGSGLLFALILIIFAPHTFLLTLGVIFGWVGFFARSLRAIYNAAIFYSIDIVMTIVTASFLRLWLMLLIAAAIVPIVVLVFVGYANQKKINEKLAAENEN